MWQPIETAPKDGTIVLLAGEFDYPGDWRIKIGYWSACDDDWYLCWASWKPTHWMPLPEAPEEPGAQAQLAPSIMDAIIDDLQSQFDSEGITEHDSGDALIRLSDAIAAVEDNFVQPAPSVPGDIMRDAMRYRFLRSARNIPISTKAARDPVVYDEALDAAMLAAAPETNA